MLVNEFSTDHLAASDRFPCWLESVKNSQTPAWVHSEGGSDFRGWVRTMRLGDVQVSTIAHSSLQVRRSAQHIRQGDVETYKVNLMLSGQAWTSQAGRDATIGAGEFGLLDTSRPFEGRWACAPDTTCGVFLEIPRALVPLPSAMLNTFAGAAFSGHRGVGAVFRRWLANLDTHATELTEEDGLSLGAVTVELLVAVLSHRLDSVTSSPESRRRVLRVRVQDYVEQRLGDPNLSPASIAAAHQISLRHLYQIFDGEDLTLSAWIRRRRLENCRRDLADPRLAARPVHVIASRWGFTDAAHFSRTFRMMYDMPPGVYRNLARAGQHSRRSKSASHN